MSTEANKALIRRLVSALCRENERAEGVAAFSDCKALNAFFHELAVKAPGCCPKLKDLIADAEKVLAIFELSGPEAHAEPYGGALLFHVENETITRYRLEPDMTNLP